MDDVIDEATFLALGYDCVRRLPNSEWLAMRRMVVTFALCVGLDERGCYRTRFCYERARHAVDAFAMWDGAGDPPGLWIKQKPEDRMNPRWLAEAKVVLNGGD